MSFFQKSKIELEKILHHSLLQRPPTPFPRPYLYGVETRESLTLMTALCSGLWGLHIRGRMVRRMGEQFGGILGSSVFGDVLKKGAEVEKNEFCCFYFYPPEMIG
jgi:hypothetical protein